MCRIQRSFRCPRAGSRREWESKGKWGQFWAATFVGASTKTPIACSLKLVPVNQISTLRVWQNEDTLWWQHADVIMFPKCWLVLPHAAQHLCPGHKNASESLQKYLLCPHGAQQCFSILPQAGNITRQCCCHDVSSYCWALKFCSACFANCRNIYDSEISASDGWKHTGKCLPGDLNQ